MAPKNYKVQVTTPSSVLEFQIRPNSTGRDLFNQVCSTIGLREVWYFGLRYRDTNAWVKLNKKISAKKSSSELKFDFKVKFYPEECSEELIQDITQTLFYYEVKSQIISSELYTPADTALLLASLQVVIRFGKYDPSIHEKGYINIPNFIPQHIRDQYNISNEEWEEKISNWHREHGDLGKQDAIMEYLKVAQDLEMYGIAYYKIKNSKQTPLWLGVDPLGLVIFEEDNKLIPKVSFPWNETRKLLYNHAKFTVKQTGPAAKDLVFYCENTKACKEILSLCTGNHELYARRRSPDSIEVQQMKAQAKEARSAREAERQKLLAERRARELMEDRYSKMEKLVQEQELAYEASQTTLSEYERRLRDLEAQLEAERRARLELEAMQRRLEDVNDQLEKESAASVEERARLAAERDKVLEEINQQQEIIRKQELEKQEIEARLADEKKKGDNERQRSIGEQDLEVLSGLDRPEDERQALADTDVDHAKRLKIMKADLESSRDARKLQQVDMRYEENVKKGMDKYRTLHAIRQGNTKKRVEQFECM